MKSIALVLPIAGFAARPTLTAQFFPGVERNQFHIEVELPPGNGIDATAAAVAALDAKLGAEDTVASRYWAIGRSAPAFYYNIVGVRSSAPGYAHAMVITDSADAAAVLVPRLQTELAATLPEARILVRGLVQGPPVKAPVELRFVGQNVDELRATGDQAAARAAGLEPGQIARQMEAALSGVQGGSLVEGT